MPTCVSQYCYYKLAVAVAIFAAIINRRRGWKDPMQIRDEHIHQITSDCMDVLRMMPEFHWWTYEAELKKRGYEVKLNSDSMNQVRGYTIKMGNSSYKASELGKERKLLASRLYRTWVQLHEQHEEPVMENRNPARPKQETKVPVIPVSLPKRNKNNGECPVKPKSNKPLESASPLPVKSTAQEIYHDSFSVNGMDYDLTIPMSVYQVMKDTLDVADDAAQTVNDAMRVAMLLFLNYTNPAATMAESLGGGGGIEGGWGRKKDDDDEEWARRCARKAAWLCKPMRRSYRR